MRLPTQITFHGMSRSEAVETAVREKAQHLEHFCTDITSCRVGLDLLQKHGHQSRPFGVRIDLTLPGHELVVNRVENEDVYVALRQAFDDMKHQIEDAVRRQRGIARPHPQALDGEGGRMNKERTAGAPEEAPEELPDQTDGDDEGRIVERPDGYHWIALDSRQEFGPFETPELAQVDMDAADENAPEPVQTLQEAERDIGIADWIDPETGEPAEGQSPPHLARE